MRHLTFYKLYKFPGCQSGSPPEIPQQFVMRWNGEITLDMLQRMSSALERTFGIDMAPIPDITVYQHNNDPLTQSPSKLKDVTLAMKDSEDTKKQLEEIVAKGRRHLRNTKKYNS